jgi:hypothetical protein
MLDEIYNKVELVALNILLAKNFTITLLCSYLSPSLSYQDFTLAIKCLESVCCKYNYCVGIGDYNLPNTDWLQCYFPCDFKSKSFYDFVSDYGFIQLITENTRNNNVLDLLLTNDPLLIATFSVQDAFGSSDHGSIVFDIALLDMGGLHDCNADNNVNVSSYVWASADWNSLSNLFCKH